MSREKSIARSAAIVSSGIMTSRILGLIRDILIAYFFGTKLVAQAFVMAFTVPNALRQLVGEGAVNTVIVPVLTEYKAKNGKAEFFRFVNILFNQFFIVLLFITALGIVMTPVLIRIIAPGFMMDPAKFKLTIDLTRILFPYILLVGLTAYCMGVLNTLKHFAAPAFASTVWNAVIIAIMLIYFRSFEIAHLVIAILFGGIAQLACQIFPLVRKGPFFNVRDGLAHEGAKKVGRLLMPRVVGAGIYQINIVVDRMLASLHLIVGQGAVAALYYGNRLFHLPLALFSVALATAALPVMSSLAVEKDAANFKKTLSFSLRNMLFLSLPASVGLMVLSRPIIKVIFEHGEFTSYSTEMTTSVLFFYAIGLVAYGGVRILVAAFHAMQDTLTPVKTAFFTLIANISLNIILMVPLKAGGLALATSIAGFINLILLYKILQRRIGLFEAKNMLNPFIKILSASAVMGLVSYLLTLVLPWDGGMKNAVSLVAVILAGMIVYLVTCLLLKVSEIKVILSWIRKR